jgi:NAD(P)-dependent dehydrogenase (short-subunit alcohol dehydrogenase family)
MSEMGGKLKSKVAIITGAARGLGAELAKVLLSEGMRVAILDVRSSDLERQAAKLATVGGEVLPVKVDLADEGQVVGAVAQVLGTWGRIDALISNAGIRVVAPVWEMSVQDWDRVQDSNLRGQFFCTREVLKQGMLEQGEGALVFISSMAGIRSVPGGCAYSSSKWGVRGFAASVAQDLKSTRICVTTILPGMVLTPMARESEVWDLGLQWLDPNVIADAVLFSLKQDPDTVVPEIIVKHRAQL